MFKYRLYPSSKQIGLLNGQLFEACRLYNAALQERKDCYAKTGRSISYGEQSGYLKGISADGDSSLANFSCSQRVLKRLDKAYKAFFSRIKKGGKAGFPRFKSARRFDSIDFTFGDGCGITKDKKVRTQGIGCIKVKWHRPTTGNIKAVSIKRKAGRWYVSFAVDCQSAPLPKIEKAVGIDVGLEHFLVTSDAEFIANPRYYRKGQASLRVSARSVARKKKGSKSRRKAVVVLQGRHEHVANQRLDFQHKLSRNLVDRYGKIAVEDLNIKGLSGGMLAKSVHDAGWSQFLNFVSYKAEEAGRDFVKVNPRGTSQECLCGKPVKKDLSVRIHHCVHCGLTAPRDFVSACLILNRARTGPQCLNVEVTDSCVALEAA